MSCRCRLAPLLSLSIALFLALSVGSALAAGRHALVVGISDYDQKVSGLASLNAPAVDADGVARILEGPQFGFAVTLLVNEAAKDKATFMAALDAFAKTIRPGDEVVFYFSGHGLNLAERGNHYLLMDGRDQESFLREERRKPGSARDLDTQSKENQRYEQFLVERGVSELEVESVLKAAGADVIIIIADACRSPISGTKGLVPVNGLRLPDNPAKGTFRLYSTRRGQVSYDAPDSALGTGPKRGDKSERGKGKDDKKDRPPVHSLFTSVLLTYLTLPRQEINVLFSNVKLEVRDRARNLYNRDQVPDYDDALSGRFYFRKQDDVREVEALCRTADAELERLRRGVAGGSVFADEIEAVRNRLAVCNSETRNFTEEVAAIIRLQQQGAGGSLVGAAFGAASAPSDDTDPLVLCDTLAASSLDQNRPQDVRGADLQAVAVNGRSNPQLRLQTIDRLTRAIQACESAVDQRRRVARYKFNLGSAHYAMAMLDTGAVNRSEHLALASRQFQDAVDLGYPAAFASLALMYQNGEYYDTERRQSGVRNRQKTRDLLQRGADLGHVLALYNLGLAYKNGTLGVTDDIDLRDFQTFTSPGSGKAFQYLSKAAEAGFLPAVIETALALRGDWSGVTANPLRAVELLEAAAAKGSWEAMYQLARTYDDRVPALKDPSEAIIWYARAAEAGDTRSQERLAEMLTDGEGLPAVQREAAGRYWRLAAAGGSMRAQMQLATLLRDGKLPFRPNPEGKADWGATEIWRLYASAFASGNPRAGLELARLYRTGFPKDNPSDVIPRDGVIAVDLLWATMDRVRQARPGSQESYPMTEIFAAHELLAMQEAGDTRRSRAGELLSPDQVDQLRTDYGERSTMKYLAFEHAWKLAKADVSVTCARTAFRDSIVFWDWKRSISPTEPQFEWFERYYGCYEKPNAPSGKKGGRAESAPKEGEAEVRGLTRVREFYRREYERWTKDREKARAAGDKKGEKERAGEQNISFADHIANLIARGDKVSSRK